MISYSTTEISISRPTGGDESWETTLTVLSSGIRAHIDAGAGSAATGQTGTVSDADYTMFADPCDLRVGDVVTDGSGRTFDVDDVFYQQGPLDHTIAHLNVRTIG